MDYRKNVRAGFGRPVPEAKHTWEGLDMAAHYEKSLMMSEFHTWVVKKRIEVEHTIISWERSVAELEPFARAGIHVAETPAEVPLVVLEYAQSMFAKIDAQRELALLDAYYKSSGNWCGQDTVYVNPGEEARFNELWAWFIEERDKEKTQSEWLNTQISKNLDI